MCPGIVTTMNPSNVVFILTYATVPGHSSQLAFVLHQGSMGDKLLGCRRWTKQEDIPRWSKYDLQVPILVLDCKIRLLRIVLE